MDQITSIKRTWPEYYDAETITLTNGEKLIRRYGKYQPGICFLISDDNALISWTDMKNMFVDLNIEFDASSVEWLPGEFWISKKGTSCFRPDENGKHILIRTYWGGPFEESRGSEYNEIKQIALYSRKAASNGGGCGSNYYVFDMSFHRDISIDEI